MEIREIRNVDPSTVGDIADTFKNNTVYIAPSERISREILEIVDTKTAVDISNRHNVFGASPWECNTVAVITIQTIISSIGAQLAAYGMDETYKARFDLFGIMDIIIDNKYEENADKSGNLNASFEPGNRMGDIIKGASLFETMYPDSMGMKVTAANLLSFDNKEKNDEYINIENRTRIELNRNYRVTYSKEFAFVTYMITLTFLENLFREMATRLNEDGVDLVHCTFNNLFAVYMSTNTDGEIAINITPYQDAKLGAKNDAGTENEFGADD